MIFLASEDREGALENIPSVAGRGPVGLPAAARHREGAGVHKEVDRLQYAAGLELPGEARGDANAPASPAPLPVARCHFWLLLVAGEPLSGCVLFCIIARLSQRSDVPPKFAI